MMIYDDINYDILYIRTYTYLCYRTYYSIMKTKPVRGPAVLFC